MRIVFLAGKSLSTNLLFNALKEDFSIEKVILEDSISRKKLLKNRIKRLGFLKVINQILFQITIPPILELVSKEHIAKLKGIYGLENIPISEDLKIEVGSVNSEFCEKILRNINPDVVIVNGTRIISKSILQCTEALFINTHVGITPQYRGVHGGYWALIANDPDNCGVTIHEVDYGIDTGNILKQGCIKISDMDNFVTYPIHQLGISIPLMKEILFSHKEGNLKSYKKKGAISKLYYHPTFTEYLFNRIYKKVK